jgi:hypothetical protein
MSTGNEPIERALAFLAARQAPSGRIPVHVGRPVPGEEPVDDGSLFATAIAARALASCDGPVAASIRRRAAEFLRSEMEPEGVWRHWTREHREYHRLPVDLDDTALNSAVLRHEGLPFPENLDLLLRNRDSAGRFYTWLILRWPPRAGRAWRIFVRRARRPFHARALWRMTAAAPGDVDAVVNANVLTYLGDGTHAAPVADYLLSVMRSGNLRAADKWYRSEMVLVHSVARCVRAGIRSLDAAPALIRERVAAATRDTGQVGTGPVDTALGASALVALGDEAREVRPALDYLLRTQRDDGSWPAEPVYFAGPRTDWPVPRWGSAELTTALCVEALSN